MITVRSGAKTCFFVAKVVVAIKNRPSVKLGLDTTKSRCYNRHEKTEDDCNEDTGERKRQ